MGRRLRDRSLVAAFALVAALAFVGVALAASHWKVKQTHAGKAVAKGAVLKKTDFPAGDGGWTGKAAKPNLSTAFSCKSAYKPKQSDLVVTGAAEMVWSNGSIGVSFDSTAQVFKTAKMARNYFRRTVSASPAVACMKGAVKKSLGSALVSVGPVTLQHVGSYSHELRVVEAVSGGSGPAQIGFDLIAFGHGRTVVLLDVSYPMNLQAPVGVLEGKVLKGLAPRAK